MHRRFLTFAFAMFLFSMITGAVPADSIKLDSGKTIEGTVVSETSSVLEIAVGGTVLKIPRSKITAISKTAVEATSSTVTVEQLEKLETKGQWADLYEAATGVLSRDTSNTVAAEKQKLAAQKIRESLGGKRIAALVRENRFDEAITTLTEQLRRSGLASRGAGAVGRRALAEIYLASARVHLNTSLDGHDPLNEVRKARELDPSTPGLNYYEGKAQMSLHNYDHAIPLLERAVHADPKNFRICLELISCYREKGEFARIVEICERSPAETLASAKRWPEVRSQFAEAYLSLATQSADKGAKAQAAAAYEKYLTFSDRSAETLRKAAAFFERIGDPERAKAILGERPGPRPAEGTGTTVTVGATTPPR